jgi:multidrug efflux pump subunit AcrA (membrane-fusion protein)
VRVTVEEHADRLVVPAESVVTNGDGQTVVAVVNQDQATQMPVQTGLREGDLVEVAGETLKPGTTIVTVGAYGLPAQTRISVETPRSPPGN